MRRLLFIVTTIYTILLITRPQEFIPGFAELPLLQPMILSAFAIWLAMPDKGFELPHFRILPILLVFVWLSLGVAGWWGGIVPAVEKLLPPMLLFVIVTGCVRSVRELSIYSTVVIVCACVLVLHGHLQVTTGIGWTGQPMIQGRITYTGIFNDPNDMGLLIVVSIAMCIFHYRTQQRWIVRMAFVAALFWLLYGVILTDSRGTMLATLLVLGLETWRAYGKTLLVVGVAVAVPVLIAFTRLSKLDAEEASAANRFDAWYEALELLRSSPAVGIGWGMFSDYHGLTAHNSIMLAMAELGLLGYTFWLAFVALSGWMIYRLVFPAQPKPAKTPLVGPAAHARRAETVAATATAAATGFPLPAQQPAAVGAAARAVPVMGPSRFGRGPVAGRLPQGAAARAKKDVAPAAPVDIERLASFYVLFAACGFALGAFFLSQSYKAMIFLTCGLIVGRYLGMREAGRPVPTYLESMHLPKMFALALVSVVVMWVIIKVLL